MFGTAVWLGADEVAVPAFRLSKPPTEYPVSVHAYAFMSHLVYGVTTDLVRRAVRNRAVAEIEFCRETCRLAGAFVCGIFSLRSGEMSGVVPGVLTGQRRRF